MLSLESSESGSGLGYASGAKGREVGAHLTCYCES